GTTLPCVATSNSDFDSVAQEYRTTTHTNANMPSPSPTRTSFTEWAAVVDAGHWFLELYDEKNETEGSNTIYRGFEFDRVDSVPPQPFTKVGFPRGQWTSDRPYDAANRQLWLDCRYPDSSTGSTKWQFSSTYNATTLD